MLVRYQAAPRPEPHGLYVALQGGSRESSPKRLPDRLQPGANRAKRGQCLRVRRRQLELRVLLPALLLEPLLRALKREPVLVEKTLDAEHHLHVVLSIDALARVVLARPEQIELGLPIAQDVRRHPGEIGHLADAKEQLVRDGGIDPDLDDLPLSLSLRLDQRWFTCAFNPLDGLNVSTRRAVISISLPVCGLRPFRDAFFRSLKCPNPTILTSLPCSKARIMLSNTASPTAADCRLESPCPATELMRSFFVSLLTPLRRHARADPPQRCSRTTTPSTPFALSWARAASASAAVAKEPTRTTRKVDELTSCFSRTGTPCCRSEWDVSTALRSGTSPVTAGPSDVASTGCPSPFTRSMASSLTRPPSPPTRSTR